MASRLLKRVCAEITRSDVGAAVIKRVDTAPRKPGSVEITLGICFGGVQVVVDEMEKKVFQICIRGLHARGKKWLYDVLSTVSKPAVDPELGELLVLETGIPGEDLATRLTSVLERIVELRRRDEFAQYDRGSSVSMYWSSSVMNVGDWCGPQLVQAMTGRTPIQVDRPGVSPRALYSVGSILGWIKRNNVDIWGSGLMQPLTKDEIAERRKLKGIEVHAVRGRMTKEHVERDLGWEVPEVFGDPALLLPRYFPGSQESTGKPLLIPHNVHRKKFQDLAPEVRDGYVDIVDVRRDLAHVLGQVSGASAVISTSLHGVIFAQAYGVPWVWLDIEDAPLWGGGFKFADFFTTLKGAEPAQTKMPGDAIPDIDLKALASQTVLPDLDVDLDALEDALPVAPAATPAV